MSMTGPTAMTQPNAVIELDPTDWEPPAGGSPWPSWSRHLSWTQWIAGVLSLVALLSVAGAAARARPPVAWSVELPAVFVDVRTVGDVVLPVPVDVARERLGLTAF